MKVPVQLAAGWTEVLVLVPRGWEELVADVLSRASDTSVAFGRVNRILEVAPEGFEWVRTALHPRRGGDAARKDVAEALAQLAETLGEPELSGLEPIFRDIPPEDWANAWKNTWRPFRVGRIAVVAPHHEELRGRLRDDDIPLELIPGGTFGTGRHATTRECLRLAQENVRPGERVLDAGTGTGILTVAAALLGAGDALGFDVDESSEPSATDLARRNRVADRCRFRTGGFEVLLDEDAGFDGLFANLYSDLLQEHAAELFRRLRPGGWFVFSGCPEHHLEPTLAALTAADFGEHELRRRGRWCTVSGRRR